MAQLTFKMKINKPKDGLQHAPKADDEGSLVFVKVEGKFSLSVSGLTVVDLSDLQKLISALIDEYSLSILPIKQRKELGL